MKIPKSYFPSEDSYYLKEHSEPYAEELRNYLAHSFERKRKIYEVQEKEIAVLREPDISNPNQ